MSNPPVSVAGAKCVQAALAAAAAWSDMPREDLEHAAEVFVFAHARVPGGVSLEIGTRNGGSALLFLRLLEELYPAPPPQPSLAELLAPGPPPTPPLFTVDPYGNKPYMGGDACFGGLYGSAAYANAKNLLAPFPNHFQWTMRSLDFLRRLVGVTWWYHGQASALGSGEVAFALLDGEHDADTILDELDALWGRWMHPRGLVLVDNTDKHERVLPGIEAGYVVSERAPSLSWVVVSGRRGVL